MEYVFDGIGYSALKTTELNGLRFARWHDLRSHCELMPERKDHWITQTDDWLSKTITKPLLKYGN